MDRYIGIDVHSGSSTVAVMGPSGKRLRQQVVDTQATVLIDMLNGIAGDRHVCIEEGELAEWLVEVLEPHVKSIVVVQIKEQAGQKSDAKDAWALAELIRIKARGAAYVFKPTTKFRPLREAVKTYGLAVKELTRAKNRFRSLLRSRGVSKLDGSIYEADEAERWVERLPAAYHTRARWLSERVEMAAKAHEAAEATLLAEAKKSPEVQRLKTAPGLGDVRAAQVVAIAVTPDRFRTRAQFWSYCGLAIVTRATGEWKRGPDNEWRHLRQKVQTRGLNTNGQPLLKAVFKGAATMVINQMHSHPLHRDYQRLVANGTAPHLARLTIARRIAAAIYAMWKKKEDYDQTKHTSQTAA